MQRVARLLGRALPAAGRALNEAALGQAQPCWPHAGLQALLGRLLSSYPPHTELQMPALSPTMSQGNLAAWSVKEGQEVTAGDILAEVETDKATLPWENQDEGFVAKLLVESGARDLPVGTPLLVLVEEEGDVGKFGDYQASQGGGQEAASSSSSDPDEAGAEAGSPKEGNTSGDASPEPSTSSRQHEVNHRIGPAAAMLLREHGLQASDVQPSGPHGIVTKGDVLAAVAAGAKPRGGKAAAKEPAAPPQPAPKQDKAPAPAAKQEAQAAAPPRGEPPAEQAPRRRRRGAGESYTDVPNSQIRKIIAQRLLQSKQEVPALYMRSNAKLAAVNSLRALLKEEGKKVSVNDFIVRAVAVALREVPGANAQWDAQREAIVPQGSVDVSIAVATDKGLITPIVRAADTKSLAQISAEVKELAAKARANKLKPEEFQGGTFSISNLGMFGVDRFVAIINPPQACILAVGGTQSTVVLAGAEPRVVPEVTVTLSADNRVVDEGTAARFLGAFGSALNNPLKLLSV